MILIKHLTLLTLTLILTACVNTPTHLIVAPEIMTTPSLSYSDKQAQLEVVDMRTANHIVQVLREGEAATLISAQQRIEKTIVKTLTKQWEKQGLAIVSSATNTINITVEKAIISVDQQIMSYKSQTEITLKVKINNGLQTLTSTFNNKGNSEGPLRADIAVLERNFNQRLTKLITTILANKKINDFIK